MTGLPDPVRIAVSRVRLRLVPLGVLLVLAGAADLLSWGGLGGLAALLLFAAADRVAPPRAPVRVVEPPVRGRWVALNSPATRVPSHGTHGLGQTHAVDLAADPGDGSHPGYGTGAQLRDPRDYPAFGAPVHAPVAGVVARVHDRRRDHRARAGSASVLFMVVVEAFVRQVAGVRWMLGNHVVVRADDGTCAVLAHLRRGSVRIAVGDRVTAGQQLAECGNSGNSSEPHLHVQLCDTPRVGGACGRPMAFRDGATGGGDGLPADGEVLTA